MTEADIAAVLKRAMDLGIRNILALRGDSPSRSRQWEPMPNGCTSALDLVRLIRRLHGSHFCIAVAAYPEGHPEYTSREGRACRHAYTLSEQVQYLKQKVDAGADFVLTQFFYSSEAYIHFLRLCSEAGIRCPIIPGIMPIPTFKFFQEIVLPSGVAVEVCLLH